MHLVPTSALLLLAMLIAAQPASAAWEVRRPAASYDRAEFDDPADAAKVRAAGNLGGSASDCCIAGWVEYDIEVPESGWYGVSVVGSAAELMFIVGTGPVDAREQVAYGGAGQADGEDRAMAAWIERGRTTIRLHRRHWTGLPKISALIVRRSEGSAADSLVARISSSMSVQDGKCPAMTVAAGGEGRGRIIELRLHEKAVQPGRVVARIRFPATAARQVMQTVPLPCDRPGKFLVSFTADGSAVPWHMMKPVYYEVLAPVFPSVRKSSFTSGRLVEEIDLASVPPSHSRGATRTVSTAAGTYRESGPSGFTLVERAPAVARAAMPAPSWFAYELRSIQPQAPYLVTIDYPDDAFRTMTFALRESSPLSYPVSTGVDSGGEFRSSMRMRSSSMLFWPRAANPRVLFATAHDGMRAAASRIRVYAIDGELEPLVAKPAGRQVLNWYEEGDNFQSIYGAPDEWNNGWRTAVDRWAQAAAASGATTLMPTVLIYSFALYPSRYNVTFSKPDTDMLRRILLAAGACGLRVLPELHPRADELTFPFTSSPDPKPNLLISKDGATNYYEGDGKKRNVPPHFNPLHPHNQRWYLDMIGELVDTYKDSPALSGVSLRLMQWTNPTLNNFHSLDWGYDDYTVNLFARETGMALPVPLASKPGQEGKHARERYAWLMANAREAWIDWRCRKIAELYTRIRDRVRQARPDLQIYSTVFDWTPASDRTSLREAGIDPALLSKIDGVVLLNAMGAYGRREPYRVDTQRTRDNQLDPARLNLMRAGRQGAFMTGANYVESTALHVPPEDLGFPAGTKRTWTSAAVNPAGQHILERYALQLAETDANIIGDGGNGYSLGQAETREWLKEYLALPAEPFTQRTDARDPVAVWQRPAGDGGLYFYVVNRERYPLTIRIDLKGASQLYRLVDDSGVSASGTVRIELSSYELRGFKLPAGGSIAKVETIVPPIERVKVEALVKFVGELANSPVSVARADGLGMADVVTLKKAHSEAASALAAGRLWRTRTRLEHHSLIAIYERIGKYPPGLRDNAPVTD